ncbi:L-cystine-binding protein TcyA [Arthrobacter sp. Hiyo8]|uniref:ABC transporter substrate-binding protein n=1 Tax=unclassified Arthrobacter TaxID=235627 RepID=UPI00068390F5|nr:ABC transporter substrate-binding protein [Arthrobacter sp. efr-133-TYG-120]BAS15793.1 L-cystine-binding protein TcyA [Arthrobacter sp. Hiyo8]
MKNFAPRVPSLWRKVAIAAVLASTLAGTAACGGSGQASSPQTNSADTSLTALVPADIKAKGTITVGTQPDFEPANFTPIGENGVKGFNIDLMDAMAAKLGLKISYQKVPFDQLLVGVQTGKFDASIAGMTDRKARQENVDFVDYQVAGTVFMVAKGNPKKITGEPDGGCGIKIGGVKGNDDERLVGIMAKACTAAGKPAPELVTFPTGSDKNLALTSGRVDAMFWPDMAVSVINRETQGKLESVPVNFEPKVFLGMIFNKQNPQLRDAFLKATEAMHADGSYDAILKKWDVTVIDLPKPGVNLATS